MLVDMPASTWIQKGSAVMLTSKQSAGVTPKVNHIGEESTQKGVHPGFENPGLTVTRSPKQGISGTIKRTCVLQKIKKQNNKQTN